MSILGNEEAEKKPILKKIADKPTEEIVKKHKYRTQDELNTSSIFNSDVELDDLKTNISGMSWEVSYFSQIKGINDEPKMPDVNASSTVLRYNRISKLIIKLQESINQTNTNEVTGTAIINSGFVPYFGDPFIATLTGGRECIFVITEVKKNNYNLHNIYNVNFKLNIFLDKNGNYYNDLVKKTMTEYVYDKDYVDDTSSPFLVKADYHHKLNLKHYPNILLKYYLKNMTNKNNKIIALPTESSIYIDTLLDNFLMRIVNRDDVIEMSDINSISYDTDIDNSIWDILLSRDISRLPTADRKIGFKLTPNVISNPNLKNISYLNIRFVTDRIKVKLDISIIENVHNDNFISVPTIDDENYIFSDDFYEQKLGTCTKFEQLVLQYLRGEVLDMDRLDMFIKEYPKWKTIHQYYLIPILILLIKGSYKNIRTEL